MEHSHVYFLSDGWRIEYGIYRWRGLWPYASHARIIDGSGEHEPTGIYKRAWTRRRAERNLQELLDALPRFGDA